MNCIRANRIHLLSVKRVNFCKQGSKCNNTKRKKIVKKVRRIEFLADNGHIAMSLVYWINWRKSKYGLCVWCSNWHETTFACFIYFRLEFVVSVCFAFVFFCLSHISAMCMGCFSFIFCCFTFTVVLPMLETLRGMPTLSVKLLAIICPIRAADILFTLSI